MPGGPLNPGVAARDELIEIAAQDTYSGLERPATALPPFCDGLQSGRETRKDRILSVRQGTPEVSPEARQEARAALERVRAYREGVLRER